MSENPYTTPHTPAQNLVAQDPPQFIELASRWARLGASILDAIILMVIFVPILGAIFAIGIMPNSAQSEGFLKSLTSVSGSAFGGLIFGAIGILVYVAINGYLLSKYGQSVGKKIVGIRVVSQETNQLLSFGKVVGIRYVVVTLISQLPFIGSLFGLIDVLFIFSADKRCLHDMLAGSIVVKATSV